MNHDESGVAQLFEFTCYKLGQILFLPSYKDQGLFVGPGLELYAEVHPRGYVFRPIVTYTVTQLKKMGAVACKEFLWSRAYDGF